jgi:hypothetical protein
MPRYGVGMTRPRCAGWRLDVTGGSDHPVRNREVVTNPGAEFFVEEVRQTLSYCQIAVAFEEEVGFTCSAPYGQHTLVLCAAAGLGSEQRGYEGSPR